MTTDPKPQDPGPTIDRHRDDDSPHSDKLAADLSRAHESQGAEGVKAFLKGALGEEMSAEDRLGAMEVLSCAQEVALDRELVVHGQTMLDTLEAASRQSSAALTDNADISRRVLNSLRGQFDEQVTRPARSGEARRVAGALEELLSTSSRDMGRVTNYIDEYGRWSQVGVTATEVFLEQQSTANRHKRALTEGKSTLSKDYEGEPKDLTAIIGDEVVTNVTARVVEALESGIDPKESLAQLVDQLKASVSVEEKAKLKRLIGAAEAIHGTLSTKRRLFEHDAAEAATSIRRGIARDRDELAYARRSDEVEDIVSRLARSINKAIDAAETVVVSSSAIFNQITESIGRLQRK